MSVRELEHWKATKGDVPERDDVSSCPGLVPGPMPLVEQDPVPVPRLAPIGIQSRLGKGSRRDARVNSTPISCKEAGEGAHGHAGSFDRDDLEAHVRRKHDGRHPGIDRGMKKISLYQWPKKPRGIADHRRNLLEQGEGGGQRCSARVEGTRAT